MFLESPGTFRPHPIYYTLYMSLSYKLLSPHALGSWPHACQHAPDQLFTTFYNFFTIKLKLKWPGITWYSTGLVNVIFSRSASAVVCTPGGVPLQPLCCPPPGGYGTLGAQAPLGKPLRSDGGGCLAKVLEVKTADRARAIAAMVLLALPASQRCPPATWKRVPPMESHLAPLSKCT